MSIIKKFSLKYFVSKIFSVYKNNPQLFFEGVDLCIGHLMKKVNASLKNNLYLKNDTSEGNTVEESNLFDSSTENSSQKKNIDLKYVFHHGMHASSLIYFGSITQYNCPTFVQSFQELENSIKDVKNIVIEFRESDYIDSPGLKHIKHLITLLNENKIAFILTPYHSKIVQNLIEDRYLNPKNSAQDFKTALRQLSFKITKFSAK